MDVLRLLLGLLPASRLKNRLLSLTGRRWDVAGTAVVGPSLFWRVTELSIGDGAFIGTANVFRGLRGLHVGARAEIGAFNQAIGVAKWVPQSDPELAGRLVLKDDAGITARHLFECAGGIEIGEFAVIGGYRTMMIARMFDIEEMHQQGKPIRIGRHCLIASGSLLLPGVTVADRCVVAAGSVVPRSLRTPDTMYAGNPAEPKGSLEGAPFLNRAEQRVIPRRRTTRLARRTR